MESGSKKKISALYIDNNLSKNEKEISSFISNFYQKLYTSSFDPQSCHIFFDKVSPFILKISRENCELREGPITIEELQSVITKMPPLCSFCKEEAESFSHLFYGCLHSTNFWTQMSLLIWESYKILVTIMEDMVLFLSVESNNKETNDVIKLLCLLGKFHIHKARFLQFIPNETLRLNSIFFMILYVMYLRTKKI